jgi:hypothetical protein
VFDQFFRVEHSERAILLGRGMKYLAHLVKFLLTPLILRLFERSQKSFHNNVLEQLDLVFTTQSP